MPLPVASRGQSSSIQPYCHQGHESMLASSCQKKSLVPGQSLHQGHEDVPRQHANRPSQDIVLYHVIIIYNVKIFLSNTYMLRNCPCQHKPSEVRSQPIRLIHYCPFLIGMLLPYLYVLVDLCFFYSPIIVATILLPPP